MKAPGDVRVPDRALGLDVGVGANAIFPLLGARLRPGWRWIGSDIDPAALAAAAATVARNGLDSRVALRQVDPAGDVISAAIRPGALPPPPFGRRARRLLSRPMPVQALGPLLGRLVPHGSRSSEDFSHPLRG